MRRLTRLTVLGSATVLIAGLTAAEAVPSYAAPTNKTFAAAMSASGLFGSDPVLVTITLTNTTKGPQPFGSANVTAPDGYALGDTVGPDVSGFTAAVDGAVLELRSATNSGVAPGASIHVGVWVTSTGSCAAAWTVQVKQSNDFSGTGNDFTDGSGGALTAASLLFSQQPTDSEYDQPMRPAPVVTASDGCGPDTSFTGPVTLADSAGFLKATGATATASGGVATFSNVTFSTWDFTDRLSASADGYPSVTSDPFTVWQLLQVCTDPTTTCSTPTTVSKDKSTGVSVSADPYTPGSGNPDVISQSLKGATAGNCNQPSTAVQEPAYGVEASVNVTARAKTVTMTLARSYVNQFPNNGTPFMDICVTLPAGSTESFTDKFGQQEVQQGLLPDCPANNGVFCIVSRNKSAGDEVISFRLPQGDPRSMVF